MEEDDVTFRSTKTFSVGRKNVGSKSRGKLVFLGQGKEQPPAPATTTHKRRRSSKHQASGFQSVFASSAASTASSVPLPEGVQAIISSTELMSCASLTNGGSAPGRLEHAHHTPLEKEILKEQLLHEALMKRAEGNALKQAEETQRHAVVMSSLRKLEAQQPRHLKSAMKPSSTSPFATQVQGTIRMAESWARLEALEKQLVRMSNEQADTVAKRAGEGK